MGDRQVEMDESQVAALTVDLTRVEDEISDRNHPLAAVRVCLRNCFKLLANGDGMITPGTLEEYGKYSSFAVICATMFSITKPVRVSEAIAKTLPMLCSEWGIDPVNADKAEAEELDNFIEKITDQVANWTEELEECSTAFALAADLSAYLGLASFLYQSFEVCRMTDQDGDGIVTKDQLVQPEMYKAIPFAQGSTKEERSQYIDYFLGEGGHPGKNQVFGIWVRSR